MKDFGHLNGNRFDSFHSTSLNVCFDITRQLTGWLHEKKKKTFVFASFYLFIFLSQAFEQQEEWTTTVILSVSMPFHSTLDSIDSSTIHREHILLFIHIHIIS